MTLPITDFNEYYEETAIWELQKRGLWSDEKPKEEIIKEFKDKDLILTQDKIDLMKKNRNE